MKLDYEHIFEWLIKNGEIKGFYHDWLGELERRGKYVSRILKTTTEGFYEAEVVINGKMYRKTFFPKHMTRTEVSQMIIDAISKSKHFAKPGAKPGSYTFTCKLTNRVEIFVVIKNHNIVKSCYPKIT